MRTSFTLTGGRHRHTQHVHLQKKWQVFSSAFLVLAFSQRFSRRLLQCPSAFVMVIASVATSPDAALHRLLRIRGRKDRPDKAEAHFKGLVWTQRHTSDAWVRFSHQPRHLFFLDLLLNVSCHTGARRPILVCFWLSSWWHGGDNFVLCCNFVGRSHISNIKRTA